jgi:hypothetical protein
MLWISQRTFYQVEFSFEYFSKNYVVESVVLICILCCHIAFNFNCIFCKSCAVTAYLTQVDGDHLLFLLQ